MDTHEMQLVTRHSSGAEEWLCPLCGRRFLLTWPPNYKKVVLEVGDESVFHSGNKGGVLQLGESSITLGSVTAYTAPSTTPEDAERLAQGLSPWLEFLRKL